MRAPASEPDQASAARVARKLRRPAFVCPSGHRFLVRHENFGLAVDCPVCEEAVRARNQAPEENGEMRSPRPATATSESPYTPLVQANKVPLPANGVAAATADRVWPLFLLVGTAAITLVGIALWLRQNAGL